MKGWLAVLPYVAGASLAAAAITLLGLWGEGRYDAGVSDETARWRADQAELRLRLLDAQGELAAQKALSEPRILAVLAAVERMDGDTAARARWAEAELRNLRRKHDALQTDDSVCAVTDIPADSLQYQQAADDFLRAAARDGRADAAVGDRIGRVGLAGDP